MNDLHLGDDDARLMLAFQQGDPASFERLFQKHKRAVISFALRFTGRVDEAEELAQEVFVKCYLAASSYEPRAKFTTWLFRIARNHCLNEVRRPSRRYKSEPFDDQQARAGAGDDPEALAATRALSAALRRELEALPENQRSALSLSREHGMSYDEIAETMDVSISAVKSLLNRAKKRLAAKLAQHMEHRHAMS
jgi:RNA polymerase sigma-70 factor (ECF subfamily)